MVTGVVPSLPPVLVLSFYRAYGSAIPLLVDLSSSDTFGAVLTLTRRIKSYIIQRRNKVYARSYHGASTHHTAVRASFARVQL